MPKGTILFYNKAKGLGFVMLDGVGVDTVVRIAKGVEGIEDRFHGERVKFKERVNRRGELEAYRIAPI